VKTINQINVRRIIVVAYRLPFKLVRKKEEYFTVQNSGGLVSAILSLAERKTSDPESSSKILWVGSGEAQLGNEVVHPGIELYPVEIPKKLNEKYYGGFCNDTIWPLFHYFPASTVYDLSYFDAYIAANELFSQKLKGIIRPGDFIWIHDYQLFLLPDLIRKSFPEADIGFFLHIPFPSFEMFRLLPRKWRESILKGMTGADVIGFHINDYTQHFMKSVKRTLGYKIDRNYIFVNDRLCKADAFPIGIDFNKFHEACYSGRTIFNKSKLQKYLSGRKLIFSVDRLDYSKGFLFRLKAFERFLEQHPEWHFRVVYNMVVVPSRDHIQEYRDLKKEIEATVGRINGKYSTLDWRPLVYQYKSLSFNELTAIYNLSDIGFLTPLRDGMNLVAKEYVACQCENYGMLVLSEMAGASFELNEAIIINPTDIEETSEAINTALLMPEAEKSRRIRKMQSWLNRYNVFTWTADFLNQADEVKQEKKKMEVKFLDNNILTSIKKKYLQTGSRLFLIDYDGTLTPLEKLPEQAIMDSETRKVLKIISSDPHNTLVIISGRTSDFLDTQFKHLDAVLVAEHGYMIRFPGSEWQKNAEIDLSWKDKFVPLLNDYVERCQGTMIEDKNASLVWHYRNAEEEIALLRINELKDDLTEILKSEPKLQMMEGDKVLEIKSVLYDKGTVANSMIKKDIYDFILALGDDSTDEYLFRVIPEYGFTIKVGSSPTNARLNIKDQSEINHILSMITGHSKKS
jgi:trehalose 6-phosphate synthase/phosphatase